VFYFSWYASDLTGGARVTWLVIIGGVAMLSCFFVVSLVLLALVLVRNHRRRRGALDLEEVEDDEAAPDQPFGGVGID
jgi:hypothetical protein